MESSSIESTPHMLNSTLVTVSGFNVGGESIVNAEQYTLSLKIFVALACVFLLLGIPSNVMNIRTYYLLGLNDGITVSFFFLSVIDMLLIFLHVTTRGVTVVQIMQREGTIWLAIDLAVFTVFMGNSTLILSAIGMFVVTILAVARCMCVAMPLHFKNVFTKSRCIVINATIVVICVVARIPDFANMGVVERFDPIRNATRISLWFSPLREEIKDNVFLVFECILPLIVQAVLIVCVALMVHNLRLSTKFRHQQGCQAEVVKNTMYKLNPRDRKVVMQVVLISLIYIIPNSIKIFNSLFTSVDPEYGLKGRYNYLYLMMNGVRGAVECLNSCVNFFVYYHFNTAFRNACFK